MTKTSLNNRLADLLRHSSAKKRIAWRKTAFVGTSSYLDDLANRNLVLQWLADEREQDALSGEHIPQEVIGVLALAGLVPDMVEAIKGKDECVYASLPYHCNQKRIKKRSSKKTSGDVESNEQADGYETCPHMMSSFEVEKTPVVEEDAEEPSFLDELFG